MPQIDRERLKDEYSRLTTMIPLLQWGVDFVDLKDCSPKNQQSFKDAWKAIQHGSLRRLEDSIENNMGSCLDVYYLQSEMSLCQRERVIYYMGLLAHAAVCGQKDMVELLLRKGANFKMGDGLSGTPLTQTLVYAYHHNCPEVVNSEIIQLLIDHTDSKLDVNVSYFICPDENTSDVIKSLQICSPIELAIKNKRIDIAKQLVVAGANPIHPSMDDASGVVQLLDEYYEFGTNDYISWLLRQHLKPQDIPQFIENVMKCEIFNEHGIEMFEAVGRNPAHALLTCGNKEMVTQFLKQHEDVEVDVRDGAGRTALQIATENRDLESVKILLKLYRLEATKDASREFGIDKAAEISKDIESTLLLAARKGYDEIVRCILSKGNILDLIEITPILGKAVKEGLTNIFEVLRGDNLLIGTVLSKNENDDHVFQAALTGNAKLFKIFFPLNTEKMFDALTREYNKKSPLHLAIDRNHLCILRTLQERIVERECIPGTKQSKEKNAWSHYWQEWGPILFVYACSHGSVDAVKLLMEMDLENDSGGSLLKNAIDENNETPLSAAARSGKDDILLYLLIECKINIEISQLRHFLPDSEPIIPLLEAAENGHASCVSILLEKMKDINVKNSDGYNCLMIATERKHSNTVKAILSDKNRFKALRFKKDNDYSPMQMLIIYLPDAAGYVLNMCVLERTDKKVTTKNWMVLKGNNGPDELDGADNSNRPDKVDNSEKCEAFEFIEHEDFILRPGGQDCEDGRDSHDTKKYHSSRKDDDDPRKYCSSRHTIKLMVKHNRKNLLNHVLVQAWINYKWWRVCFPHILLSLVSHLLYVALLTAFALVLPITCTSSSTLFGLENSTNNTDISNRSCEGTGVTQDQKNLLITYAVIIILCSIIFILLEFVQIYIHKWKYLKDPHNGLQVVLYLCVVIFVFPLGHTCWCYPSWRWQIGAVAVFLVWVNYFFLLKHIPHVGQRVTMLFNVYLNFLSVIYLPILLVLTFAFPLYMTFVGILEGDNEMAETFYSNPFEAMFNIIIQMASGPDAQFFTAALSHQIMAYALFIVFIFAVPILFNNFLIGIAVGEAEEERVKADFSLVKLKVNYIFEIQDSYCKLLSLKHFNSFFRKFILRYCYGIKHLIVSIDKNDEKLLEEQNKEILKFKGDVLNNLCQLQSQVSRLEGDMQINFRKLENEVKSLREKAPNKLVST